jgi:DNA-binding NtrC family response regulator
MVFNQMSSRSSDGVVGDEGGLVSAQVFASTLDRQREANERNSTALLIARLELAGAEADPLFGATINSLLGNPECVAHQPLPNEYELLFWDSAAKLALRYIAEVQRMAESRGNAVRIGVAECPADASTPVTLRALARSRMQGRDMGTLESAHSVLLDSELVRLYETAKSVASGNISVFISGETGTGKELLARSIHRHSPRAAQPFLGLNCAALNESLLESELFGHEKGSFTGAIQGKAGLLESANGGTIFLDEVGEMAPSLQVKLLRVMEERSVMRVGALRPRPIDVRFVSATHRNLQAEVLRGQFRSDLYYRLNGVTLSLPALRERPAELEPLARLFCERVSRECGLATVPKFSYAALERLLAHDWPGNVRELRNVVERAVLLCRSGVIEPEHLALEGPTEQALQPESPSGPLQLSPQELAAVVGGLGFTGVGVTTPREPTQDISLIVDALNRCGGNQTQAARLLGISRGTLISRIAQHDLPRPRKRRR